MQLAINYSHQAVKLLNDGKIQIDRFKCPDWPDLIAEAAEYCPVAVHFTLRAGSGELKNTDWNRIEKILKKTETPYVNLHFEAKKSDFPNIPFDNIQRSQVEEITNHLYQDVLHTVQQFGPENVIIENVPYRGTGHKVLKTSVLPEIISQVVNQTGCGLLLDISHARISAHHLNMDERLYMNCLPVKMLRELHFTGIHKFSDRWQDHLSILEDDWPILNWVLEQIQKGDWAQSWMLAYEYGGVGEKFACRSDPDVIATDLPKLRRITNHY